MCGCTSVRQHRGKGRQRLAGAGELLWKKEESVAAQTPVQCCVGSGRVAYEYHASPKAVVCQRDTVCPISFGRQRLSGDSISGERVDAADEQAFASVACIEDHDVSASRLSVSYPVSAGCSKSGQAYAESRAIDEQPVAGQQSQVVAVGWQRQLRDEHSSGNKQHRCRCRRRYHEIPHEAFPSPPAEGFTECSYVSFDRDQGQRVVGRRVGAGRTGVRDYLMSPTHLSRRFQRIFPSNRP